MSIGKVEFLDLCDEDDEAAVRSALEEQPELVQCRDTRTYWEGFTPLHHASIYDREEVVRVLLEHGAEVNAQCMRGASPLHFASYNGHEEVARLLLAHGADVGVRDADGRTALHRACEHGSEAVLRLLLEHGADRSVVDNHGRTMHDVAEHGSAEATVLLDTYVPVVLILLGLSGPSESPLTRLAGHELFEPKVLSLIKCLLTGEENKAFEQLQRQAMP